MNRKAEILYDEAVKTFEEYGKDDMCVWEMLDYYYGLLCYCNEELLDLFEVSYDTELWPYIEEKLEPDEEPNSDSYIDPSVMWTPKKDNQMGQLWISCRGYSFKNGPYLDCDIVSNNDKKAQQCFKLIKNYWT